MNGKQLKNSILQWAIQGKLVPQDASEEPAIELLKRFKPKIKPITEDVPFEVPKSWVWCTLKDICVFLSRGRSPKYSEEKKYPVFAQKCNLKNGWISLAEARFLDPSTLNQWREEYKLKTGDILINSTGTGTVCRTRLFDEKCLGNYPFVVPDSHVTVARIVDDVNSKFVLYYISSPLTQQYLEDNLAGSTNQKELYIGVLENLLIPLPPIAEQKRIVAKIEELMPLVERYTKAQEGLDKLNAGIKGKLRASILQEAIQGHLVPQDANEEPAIELLKRLNPKFTPPEYEEELPKGWSWCKLKDCGVSILNGYAFKSNEYTNKGIRVIRITNVQDGNIVDDDPKFYSLEREIELKKYLLKENDLLMSLTGNVGRVGFIPSTLLPAALNQRVACLRFGKDSILKLYLFYFLQTYSFRTDCVNSGKGSAQLNISTEWLKNYIVSLPPLAEQKRIVEKIEELFAVLDNGPKKDPKGD